MKRYVATFLLLIYLLLNAGISYSMHFCGNKLTSTQVFTAKKGCICSAKHETPPNCCKEVKVVSSDEDQKVPNQPENQLEKAFNLQTSFSSSLPAKLYKEIVTTYFYSESPPFYKLPIFILNHSFRL